MIRWVFILLLVATGAWAVEPDEMLDDPVLEERARELSKGLRCLVCRNESIDESNAELARDLRILVRERLVAGDTDEEVIDFLVTRFGEYVLLNPQRTGSNLILWLAGPAALLTAGGVFAAYMRRRPTTPKSAQAGLSVDEQKKLAELLEDDT
ncbi:MAG: cytochrome c-type biogenesis protein CcmH [Boseongicola sp.]|nr:cytochrome c-type biogenesis protein CcmH [Boseongicola sp.]MDD9977467.1 cytochrome c-type biogenesis protein CcmH [Boseongicola sp.]